MWISDNEGERCSFEEWAVTSAQRFGSRSKHDYTQELSDYVFDLKTEMDVARHWLRGKDKL